MENVQDEALVEAFEYLDDLRESGVTNMFGSPAYVQTDLGYNRKTAFDLVGAWMETCDGRSTVQQRVATYIASTKDK